MFYNINDPEWGANLKTGLTNLLKSVLDERGEIGKYLEGIGSSEGIQLPELKKGKPIVITKKENDRDISGFWKGGFGGKSLVEHRTTMSLLQDGDKLSATMTITFHTSEERKKIMSVVQETFSGYIREDKVNLTGVNYSVVKRGTSKSYSLDSFELTLSNNDTKMIGKLMEEGKAEGIASFTKEEEEEVIEVIKD